MVNNLSYSDRRSFLKKVCNLFSLAGLFTAIILYLFYVFPKHLRKKKIEHIYACEEDELPTSGVKRYIIEYPSYGRPSTKKIFIVNTGKELFTLSANCTHLGCLVNWYRSDKRFRCPCHSGQYDISGNVISGPPPAPLKRLSMKIKHQKVYIGLKV